LGQLGNVLKGRGFATLKSDSLFIYYNHIATGRRLFIGKRISQAYQIALQPIE
jgi:hypothetical protein